jgi:ERCC4-type nuclease
MSIILDTRETKLISILTSSQPIKIEQLPVGDAWIMNGEEMKLVIERKTTADFEASFLDGRYREQRTRLLSYCSEKKAKPLYILEGGINGSRRKLERKTLQKLLHRLLLRYGIGIWFTDSTEDTASTLQILSEQIIEDNAVFNGEVLSYTDVTHITKKGNKDDPKVFMCTALQSCPGVSGKIANKLCEVYTTFSDIICAEEETVANIKVGERRIGPVIAKRLKKLLGPSTTDIV